MKARKGRVWKRTAAAIGGVALFGASVALGAGFAGALDPTFGGGTGIVPTSGLSYRVAIQPINGSERYLVAGEGPSYWVVLAYTPSGSLDPTFGAAGDGSVRPFQTDPNSIAYDLSLDHQNRVIVGGTSTVRTVTVYGTNKKPTGTKSYRGMTVVRLTADGRLDTSFNGTGIATVWAGSPDGYHEFGLSAVAVPPSLGGGILGAGFGYYVESPARRGTPAVVRRRTFFAKFRDDGTLDTTFGTNGIAYDPRSSSPGRRSRLQRDGKIVVTGGLDWSAASPDTYTDTPAYSWVVSRFTSNGELDTMFGSGGRVIRSGARVKMGRVNAVDDSIVAVGDASTAGEAGGLVARYLANGTPDPTFDGDGYAAVTPWASGVSGGGGDLAVQLDGRVVFCGSALVGSVRYGLVGRFTADGSPDSSFSGDGYAPLLPSTTWWGIAEAADGIVVASGYVSQYAQIARYGK